MFDGFLNIDKPLGMTSHDVVARVRRHYRHATGSKKVGHAGTLDPLATGVLVICLGQSTRLSDYVMHTTKRYRATLTLGTATTTYDAEGEAVATVPVDHLSQSDLEVVLPQFIGDIAQVPPVYSAIKQGGKKLYELARAGETPELAPRAVTIHSITLVAWQLPTVVLDVTCGAGTYIRSLAHDIGQVLGVGAHLGGLVRTQSGGFLLENAIALETLTEDGAWLQHIISPRSALGAYPSVELDESDCQNVQQGRVIAQQTPIPDGMVMGYNRTGALQAVLYAEAGELKPQKVFSV